MTPGDWVRGDNPILLAALREASAAPGAPHLPDHRGLALEGEPVDYGLAVQALLVRASRDAAAIP